MPEARPRARDLGITIGVLPPGPLNAITGVAGVRVGHCTIWEGEGPGRRGVGPARTGVTAIVPPGDFFGERLYAGCSVLNGCGEIIGITENRPGSPVHSCRGGMAVYRVNPWY